MTISDDNKSRARELAEQFVFSPHVFSDEKTVVLKDIAYARACENLASALASAELRGRIEGLTIAKTIAEAQQASDVDWAIRFPDESVRMGERAHRAETIVSAISARLASLQPEVAKREDILS